MQNRKMLATIGIAGFTLLSTFMPAQDRTVTLRRGDYRVRSDAHTKLARTIVVS